MQHTLPTILTESKIPTSNNYQHQDEDPPLEFNPSDWNLKKFQIGMKVGKGSFGKVYLARTRQEHFICCLKQIDIERNPNPKFKELVKREIVIQSALHHKNCVQLYGFFLEGKYMYLILEYLTDGTLFDRMNLKGRFTEPEAAHYVKQICEAFCYLKTKGICHRDLKPENIMMSDDTAKLADFGWSNIVPSSKRKFQTYCGTLDYIAPEIIEGRGYDISADAWSLGVLAFELSCGYAPF